MEVTKDKAKTEEAQQASEGVASSHKSNREDNIHF
jgi:hypothetical protein